jgi:hypothetical protein
MLVFNIFYFEKYCEYCGEKYAYYYRTCKPCLVNYLKRNFSNWTSGNEKINYFIQEKQLNGNQLLNGYHTINLLTLRKQECEVLLQQYGRMAH